VWVGQSAPHFGALEAGVNTLLRHVSHWAVVWLRYLLFRQFLSLLCLSVQYVGSICRVISISVVFQSCRIVFSSPPVSIQSFLFIVPALVRGDACFGEGIIHWASIIDVMLFVIICHSTVIDPHFVGMVIRSGRWVRLDLESQISSGCYLVISNNHGIC